MSIITLKATDGSTVEFVDNIIGQGGMKDVYFSPDRSYVVAFFRDKQDYNARERLMNITGDYRRRIFEQEGGDYWSDLFCWPTKVVEHNGRLGVVAPTYQKKFFFEFGSVNNDAFGWKGKEKIGKSFASAKLQKMSLDPREKGDWYKYVLVCLRLARACRRMHAAGLAHSDLSYNNVLIDPLTGSAAIIDIDGLVVPGKFPPDVVGTPGFIAPEVMATSSLDKTDPRRKLPSTTTDRHALAVLIYEYLLRRHPLEGSKVWDLDSTRDNELSMGERALFVEHPTDATNRVKPADLDPRTLPWGNPSALPYTVTGPYLKPLFDRAFIDGLHAPERRPTSEEWESALLKTVDLMQPCQNKGCEQKWFVFNNTPKPSCPFCGTAFVGQLPMLDLYSARQTSSGKGTFTSDNHRLMVYQNPNAGHYLYAWHTNNRITPNERIAPPDRRPVGYFALQNGKWYLVNNALPDLEDKTNNRHVPIGDMLELQNGQQILFSKADGGRLAIVMMVN